MRILLVYPAPPSSDWPRGIFRSQWVPTGIACIATVLRRSGHQVKVFVTEEQLWRNRFDWPAARAGLRTLMQEFAPQMVGVSLVTPGVPEGRSIAQDAKTICGPATLVVAGGPHASALPEELLQECPEIDVAVLGEGEITMRELAECGPGPAVRGIVFRTAGEFVRTTARVVAATNTELDEKIEQGEFLQDLYDRLAFEIVHVPALRERADHIELLAHHFLNEFMKEIPSLRGKRLSKAAIDVLRRHSFPGNIRELKNIIERAAYRDTTDEIAPGDIGMLPERHAPPEEGSFEEKLAALKSHLIADALQRAGGNQAKAARLLGLSYHQFRHYQRRYPSPPPPGSPNTRRPSMPATDSGP